MNKTMIQSKRQKKPRVSYEAFVWFVFGVTTILAIVDRFTTNVWPRQMFTIGKGFAGKDQIVGLKEGPWSVVAYDVIARISGRHSICAFNLLLIVRLRSLEHAILSSNWVNNILDCSNIIKANLRLHKWNAILLCVLTLIHVWSILLPCVTHGYSAKVIPGVWEWPISERKPPGFKDADAAKKQMSLQVDDVFRLIEMTILMCVLIPLSVKWLSTRWHIGMPLHRLINVLYFVDIVRRHTHPHSWVLNTPVFCAWIFDKVWFWYSNRTKSIEVHRAFLGDDYMILYWKHCEADVAPAKAPRSIVSPDYHLRLRDSSFFESAHVFTCFENRTNTTIDVNGKPFEWTVGSVIRVFRNKRTPRLGAKDPISHTSRMYDLGKEELDITAWGPYHSEMSVHLREYLLEENAKSVILIGTGSGIGYIVDILQWRKLNAPNRKIKVLFSTRDLLLFRWVKQTIQDFATTDGKVEIHLALTGKRIDVEDVTNSNAKILGEHCHFDFKEVDCEGTDSEMSSKEDESTSSSEKSLFVKYSHHNFEEEIDEHSTVFSQGSFGLNKKVGEICRAKKAKFYAGLHDAERIEMLDALIESVHRASVNLGQSVHRASINLRRSFLSTDPKDTSEKEDPTESETEFDPSRVLVG